MAANLASSWNVGATHHRHPRHGGGAAAAGAVVIKRILGCLRAPATSKYEFVECISTTERRFFSGAGGGKPAALESAGLAAASVTISSTLHRCTP